MKRKLTSIIIVLSMIILAACGTLTVKQRQLSTLDNFNFAYSQYLNLYDKQTPAVKAEWKANIDPYWREASKAIDVYMTFTDPNSTEAQNKLMVYETAIRTAKDLLLKYGVTIKEK